MEKLLLLKQMKNISFCRKGITSTILGLLAFPRIHLWLSFHNITVL